MPLVGGDYSEAVKKLSIFIDRDIFGIAIGSFLQQLRKIKQQLFILLQQTNENGIQCYLIVVMNFLIRY